MADAMALSGNASIAASNVQVNSASNKAVALTGNASLSANQTNIVGSDILSGNAKIFGSVTLGASAVADPLLGLPAPSTANLPTVTNSQFSGGTNVTLEPGIYPNPLSLSGHSNVHLKSGVYVLQAGISISGQSSLSGDGVLLYIAGGSVGLTGGSSVHLTPATSGDYADVSIFQARNNSATGSLTGNSGWTVSGTVYMPAAAIDLSGCSGSPQDVSLIVNAISMSGGSFILGNGPYHGHNLCGCN